MKTELIRALFEKFEQARYLFNAVECRSARSLQTILGYSKWENFSKVLEKAKIACEGSGVISSDHFPDIRKMVDPSVGISNKILHRFDNA